MAKQPVRRVSIRPNKVSYAGVPKTGFTPYERMIIKDKGYTPEDVMAMEDCPYSYDVEEKINWNEFIRALKERDFSEDDKFWLNGVQFEVEEVRF